MFYDRENEINNSLSFYRGTGHVYINNYLRKNVLYHVPKETLDKHITNIDHEINSDKVNIFDYVVDGTLLFRGVNVSSINDLLYKNNNMIIIDKAYSSTSLSINTSLAFSGKNCCIFVFKLPEDINYYKCKPGLTLEFNEEEVLLQRGICYYDIRLLENKHTYLQYVRPDLQQKFKNLDVYTCKIRPATREELSYTKPQQ